EHRRRGRAGLDVDEHPRAKPPATKRLDVVAKSELVAGPARVVAVRAVAETLRRELLVVPDVERLHAASAPAREPAARRQRLLAERPRAGDEVLCVEAHQLVVREALDVAFAETKGLSVQ